MRYRLTRLGIPGPLYLRMSDIGCLYWGEETGSLEFASEEVAHAVRAMLPDHEHVEATPS